MISERKSPTYIAALITVFFWASAFPAVKYCLRFYSPQSIMLFRFLVASVVLLSYCVAKKKRTPSVKDFPLIGVAGAIGIFAYMWLFNTGTSYVASGVSSFIIAIAPVFTLVFSIFLLKEKLRPLSTIGIFISFVGLMLVMFGQTRGISLNRGFALLLTASACTGIYNIFQRKLLKIYSPIEATTYSVVFATILMLVFSPNLLTEFKAAPLSANLIIVYLGIFPAALSYFLWGYALSKAKQTVHITSFLYLTPFIATIIAFFWLNETVPLLSFIGGLVIISGMVFTNTLGLS